MNVLVACEYSGRVREAFRALGHTAWSCDLLPAEDGSVFHFEGDVRDFLALADAVGFVWDLLIAHPPCTYLTVAGLHWNKRDPARDAKTEEALAFVQYLLDLPINQICIENPVSCISSRIRKPDQIIQPYDFGENASKKTCLWLKNLRPLKIFPAARFPGRLVSRNGRLVERWANQTDSGQNRLGPSEDRWKDRSRTYPKIAEAFALNWGCAA